MQFSTGLANYVAATGSVKTALQLGFLTLYTPPTDPNAGPDDALTGSTLLGTFTKDNDGSTGLSWGSAVNRALPKAVEDWMTTWAATGVAAIARFTAAGDDPTAASTTSKRVQMTVGVAGADITMGNPSVVSGDDFTLDSAEIDIDP